MRGLEEGASRAIAIFVVLLLAACGSSAPVSNNGVGTVTARCVAPQLAGGLSSLYTGSGHRPGPDILYEPLADAPQLQNTGIWQATPILISGASAYRCGEFLYQDYLYDDHGAKGVSDPTDPLAALLSLFSATNGTYTYPTGPGYAGNAADLVEFRVKPTASGTAFRITLNTLLDPTLAAFTIALGGTGGSNVAWPHGANVSGPGALFLTVHGTAADLLDATGKAVDGGAPSVSIDPERRQYTVVIPHTAWDPTGQVIRIAMGVGLWDATAGSYLVPGALATSTTPGGAGTSGAPAAFFNLAFRYNAQEPFPELGGLASSLGSAFVNQAWWRDQAQGTALASGDVSPFFANVDFTKLAGGVNDDMLGDPSGTPQSGPMNRIFASHFEPGQGVDYTKSCTSSAACTGEYLNRLQPYAIYVPAGTPPPGGWGLTLLLHSLSANYNQFSGTQNQSQFSARGNGSIVITDEARGPDGWYYDYTGADVFEMWADVAARFPLNPADTAVAGYSMGGYGTYKFATQFPDLFGKAQPTVGPPGLGAWLPPAPPIPGGAQSNTNAMLPSVRNIPFLIWDGVEDELVPVAGAEAQASTFGSLGYRYEFDLFLADFHLTQAINDEFQPAADFLGAITIDYNPPHVTYVYNPTMDFPEVGTAAGHAYWVSSLSLRDVSGDSPMGTIDVRSEGFGVGDPTPSGVAQGSGTLQGGDLAPMPYVSQTQTWGQPATTPVADVLDISATNIASAVIDPARAHVDCNAKLNVTSDGPITITLAGCQ